MKRATHSATKKAQVALEAIRGELTIPEIVQKYGVHPTMVHRWKKELLGNASEVFESGVAENEKQNVSQLEQKVGQLLMENDFLKKSWNFAQKNRGCK